MYKRQNFDSGCEEALREILVYLQAQNIENVLFVRFPHQRKFENPEAIDLSLIHI